MMTTSFDDAVKPRETPLPHLNFARNSLATPSNFEIASLKFRGFLTIAHLSDHQITCEIGDEGLEEAIPELRLVPHRSQKSRSYPNTQALAPIPTAEQPHAGRHAHLINEHARTIIRFPEILRSADEQSRHNRRIVTACARSFRSCVRSHFALQLLGFRCDLNYWPIG